MERKIGRLEVMVTWRPDAKEYTGTSAKSEGADVTLEDAGRVNVAALAHGLHSALIAEAHSKADLAAEEAMTAAVTDRPDAPDPDPVPGAPGTEVGEIERAKDDVPF